MSWRGISIVYRKELVDSLRDWRTIVSMIVLPLLVLPLLWLGVGGATATTVIKAAQEVPQVMVIGGEDSPKLMAALQNSSALKTIPPRDGFANLITNKVIRAAARIPEDFDSALENGQTKTVAIYHLEGDMKSQMGAERLERFFRDLRETTVRDRLQALNLPANFTKPFDTRRENVAPQRKALGEFIGSVVPWFVMFLALTGAVYPAIDLTTGEKERGTMETLLCCPVPRSHLVLGKFLLTFTSTIVTAALSICSIGGMYFASQKFLISKGLPLTDQLSLGISAKSLLALFVMLLPIAMLLSAVQLSVSLFAKSVREAQSYFVPVMLMVIMPGIVAMMPGVELNTGLALVPLLNAILGMKEIFAGTFHWGSLCLIFLSSCLYAALALALAVAMFKRESVLFRS